MTARPVYWALLAVALAVLLTGCATVSTSVPDWGEDWDVECRTMPYAEDC